VAVDHPAGVDLEAAVLVAVEAVDLQEEAAVAPKSVRQE
jgi:hypothetical protein